MSCAKTCLEYNESCPNNDCRNWINYEEDLNCTLIAANKGPLTLDEVGKRLGLTLVRIKQIEEEAKTKLKKRLIKLEIRDTIY
jgi:hypothetical protein